MKLMVLARKRSKSKGLFKKESPTGARTHFAICVKGTGFDTLIGRAYQLLQDRKAARMGCVRIIDESGEDYLYPSSWFVRIHLNSEAERRVATALTR